jgi:hypothetical protein
VSVAIVLFVGSLEAAAGLGPLVDLVQLLPLAEALGW